MSPWIWLGIAVVMAIIEAASLGFITVWFVIGGIVAFIANWCGASLLLQIILFLAVSVVLLLVLRPFAMRYRNRGPSKEPTPVGGIATVVETIPAGGGTGRVATTDRMTWTAISSDGSEIPEGTQVRIVNHESIKLIVERI